METLIGFGVGYLVGTRQGRDGLRKMRESIDAIRTSPVVRQAVADGVAVAGRMSKQVLSGGGGTMIVGALEAVSRKADDLMGDETQGRHAA